MHACMNATLAPDCIEPKDSVPTHRIVRNGTEFALRRCTTMVGEMLDDPAKRFDNFNMWVAEVGEWR